MIGYSASHKPVDNAFHSHPKWKHHPDGRSMLVNTEEEEAALGDEWVDFKHQIDPKKKAALPDISALHKLEAENERIKAEYNDICDLIASALTAEELDNLGDRSGPALARMVIEIISSLRPKSDIDDLLKQAEELGIKVDKRWGADRLKKEIADALE